MIFVRIVGLVLALSQAAPCQELVWERVGIQGMSQVGGRMAAIVDINGDGCEDLVHIVMVGGGYPDTELWFLSGKDGSTLRKRPIYQIQRPFERVARAGDWDRDGKLDYVTMGLDLILSNSRVTRPS